MSPHMVPQVSGEICGVITVRALVHPVGVVTLPCSCGATLDSPLIVTLQPHLLGMPDLFIDHTFEVVLND